MRIKIIDNKGVERFITQGKEYDVVRLYTKGVGIICDNGHEFPFFGSRYEVIDDDLTGVVDGNGKLIQEVQEKPVEKPLELKKPKPKQRKLSLFESVLGRVER